MTKQIPISFEFFPSKTDVGAEKLKVVHQELQLLNPEFFLLPMVQVVLLVNALYPPLVTSMAKVHL